MSKIANDLSNILKDKNIDLNSVLSNLNSNGSNTSSKSQTSLDLNSLLNTLNNSNKSSEQSQNNNNNSSNGYNNKSNTSNNKANSSFDPSSIDIETLLKLKKAFDSINSMDDSRSHLLLSLKPFLKSSRKDKVDQYIKILNMTKLINLFGGDKK